MAGDEKRIDKIYIILYSYLYLLKGYVICLSNFLQPKKTARDGDGKPWFSSRKRRAPGWKMGSARLPGD
jgi:hypothetical protein